MARIEYSIHILRPVADVFAVVADPEKVPQYSSGTAESKKLTEGPIGVGTRFRQVVSFLGRRIESEAEITEYEPNKHFTIKSTSGPFPFTGHYRFESEGDGTRLDWTGEADVGGFFKLAEPLVIAAGRRQFEAGFQNLKDLMEAGAL